MVIIDQKLAPSNMFKCLFKAIDCYTRDKKIEQASQLVDTVQMKYTGPNVTSIRQSSILRQQLEELRIYRSILNIMVFKLGAESHQFTYANLNQDYDRFFQAIMEATKNNELAVLHALTHMKHEKIKLSEGHMELLHRHYKFVSESLESQLLKQHMK